MKSSVLIVIVTILILGAGRYLRDLDTYEGLWVDEGWSVEVTHFSNLIDATNFIASDVHPPLYFYILYIWQQFTGHTLFALRYLSVLTVLITACIIYALGANCVHRSIGVFATILYLLHDLVWVLGREVRQYPLLQLLTVLIIYTYWRFWEKPTRSSGIIFVLSGTALMWTHYWGGFVLLALFLHFFVTRRQFYQPMLIAFSMIALAFIPWLPALYSQLTKNVSEGIGHALPADSLGYKVLAFQILGRPEIFWMALVCLGLYVINRKADKLSAKGFLFIVVIFFPLVLSILLNIVYPSLSFRVLSLIIPAMLIVIASSIMFIPKNFRWISGVFIVGISFSLTSAEPPLRLPWRSVAEYVSLRSDSNDAVLIETWFDSYAYAYYLREQGDVNFIPTELLARDSDSADLFVTDLRDSLVNYDGLWITRFSPQSDISPILNELGYNHTGTLIQETGVAPIELLRFDRIDYSESASDTHITFENQIQIIDYSIIYNPETVTVQLLWSTLAVLEQNYIVSVFLLNDDGLLVTQNDSPPLDGNQPTPTWHVGNIYYDAHVLDISTVSPGTYQLVIKLYWFTDNNIANLNIVSPVDCEEQCEFHTLSSIQIGG